MYTTEQLISRLDTNVDRPINEVFLPGFEFSDYRLSYGIHCVEPEMVYFLAIYPAFCLNSKAMFHYASFDVLQADLNTVVDFCADIPGFEVRDIVAAVFALSRGKESIELFQEQVDFMSLGVKHMHLDNYYQDFIKNACAGYFETGKLLDRPLNLSFLPKVGA